ncbi:ribosomal-protein-alanine N-acetyltransferase [Tumebacillus sp. BK434]|uniref:GNAT family N-acetyltransferase n=1 Tax=Tumebacillus sp. BK434 TaxID=2512169 RepID=UPI00104589C8|nr:GNAT family protein [Tumebacillus sp. BK434]TCP52151.1 ribosomal-protein-alanine N-acetyltransferase [Tumebacillus sp. BK434]
MEAGFPRLETERLVLRQVRKEDAEDLFAYLSDFEVMKHYGTDPFERLEQVYQTIIRYDDSFQNKTTLRLGIEWKESGRLIGTCGYYGWEPKEFKAEMVAVLRKEYWGQGIMTEAFHKLIQYGFQELGLHRLQGTVESHNAASRRLFEKIGFQQEGVLRHGAFVSGEFCDLVIYGLLRNEYEQK